MAEADGRPVLEITGLTMSYAPPVPALDDVGLCCGAGECVAVLGANGSGKSTLLRCAARLREPTAGTVRLRGEDLTALRGARLRERRRRIGLVLQSPALVGRRSALANVAVGALGRHRGPASQLGRWPRAEQGEAARCLHRVGMLELAHRRADTLSGGQAQRVAVARALCQRPLVLLADEPVASLDPRAAHGVMTVLRGLAHEDGLAVMVVLHQPDLALPFADRVVGMRQGRVVFDLPSARVDRSRIALLYAAERAERTGS
ncbi:phosphonate ABC transporter ATP-binding protein [Streptomyces sp. NPDC054796]